MCVCVVAFENGAADNRKTNKRASLSQAHNQQAKKTHVVNVKTRSDVTLYLNRLSETSKTPAQREQMPAANW